MQRTTTQNADKPQAAVAAKIAEAITPPPPAAKPEAAAKPDAGTDYAKQLAAFQKREAQLVYRDRQLKAQAQQLKAYEAQLKAARDEAKRELDEFKAKRDAARADPLKWLEFGGHDYDSASRQMLNDKKPLPEEQIAALRKETQERLDQLNREAEEAMQAEKRAQEQARRNAQLQAQREAALTVKQFESETIQFVTENAKDFKFTNLYQAQAHVPALIAAYYEQTLHADKDVARMEGRKPVGKLMKASEAAKLVEQHLTELHKKAVAASAEASTEVPGNTATAVSETVPKGQRPEVTNREVAAPTRKTDGEWISPEERWERAKAALAAPGAVRSGSR